MLEKQPYPWKLKPEELPPTLQAGSSERLITPNNTRWFWLGVSSLAGFSVLAAFLGWQTAMVQAADEFALPKPSAEKALTLQIIPSPNRYALWAHPTSVPNEDPLQDKPAPTISLSPPPEFPAVLLNNPTPTPPTIPVNLPVNIPALPTPPTFNLIGIAQGNDGTVATIKVQDGNSEEIKDVRQGAPVLPGYTVTQIAEEYVLLKTSKGGKTLRVD
jgi:hypothetical protein